MPRLLFLLSSILPRLGLLPSHRKDAQGTNPVGTGTPAIRLILGGYSLTLNGLDPGDQPPILSNLAGRIQPLGLGLKTETKECLRRLITGRLKLFVTHLTKFSIGRHLCCLFLLSREGRCRPGGDMFQPSRPTARWPDVRRNALSRAAYLPDVKNTPWPAVP